MHSTPDEQIQIRCTNCGQRFKVGNELYGRIVECGACENRFRVTEDTVIRNKKYYPKEKNQTTPITYARLSGDAFGNVPQQEFPSYEEMTANSNFDPTPFSRTLPGIIGGFIMALVLLLFVTSGKYAGILSGMSPDKRITLALFTAVICSGMIIYANPRSKIKAGIFALMGSILLLLAPIYIKSDSGKVPKLRDPILVDDTPSLDTDETNNESIEKIREDVGYTPMEKALAKTINKKGVIGIWLRDTNDSNSLSVFDYLKLITKSDNTSQKYERVKNKSFLVVLIGSSLQLNQVALECQRVGEVLRTIPELNLIEVKVANSKFNERPDEVLNNPKHSAFYEMNLMELEGINQRRINSALKRLILAPPTQSRTDIVRRMNQLLTSTDHDELFSNLAHAIPHWSSGDDGSAEAMMQVVSARFANNKTIEPIAIRFLVSQKQPLILPILEQLWLKDPQKWEEIFILAGENAEPLILPHLADGSLMHKLSACRIASRIGTDQAVKKLNNLLSLPLDNETKTAFELTSRTIEERLSK